MIPAHGAQLSVTATSIRIDRSALLTALTGQASVEVPLSQVTGVRCTPPSLLDGGVVTLEGPGTTIAFAPGQAQAAEDFLAAIEAARQGEAPAVVPGLDFVALDVETANDDLGSVCQIGVVKFVDGVEVDAASWLCAPPPGVNEFRAINVSIHGITADDVAGQPRVAERIPALQEFVGDLPVIAHNAQFDMMALRRACLASDVDVPELTYGCSLVLARAAGLDSLRLPDVARALGVPLDRHHDALEDARAAAGIIVALARKQDHRGGFAAFQHASGYTVGTLSAAYAYPVLRDRSGARSALQQRVETPAPTPPKAARRAPWQSVATPDVIPEANPDADPTGVLFGEHVTLTGDFDPYDKGQLWSAMADLGADVGKNVTKKTTILVAGTWATKTSKEKRAEELIAQGQDIQIWTGDQLIDVLGLDAAEDEQPPF